MHPASFEPCQHSFSRDVHVKIAFAQFAILGFDSFTFNPEVVRLILLEILVFVLVFEQHEKIFHLPDQNRSYFCNKQNRLKILAVLFEVKFENAEKKKLTKY